MFPAELFCAPQPSPFILALYLVSLLDPSRVNETIKDYEIFRQLFDIWMKVVLTGQTHRDIALS